MHHLSPLSRRTKAITKASADPLDKAKLRAIQKKSEKKPEEEATITTRKRRVEASDEEVAPKKIRVALVAGLNPTSHDTS